MPVILKKLIEILCLPGRWLSWLILPLILSILIVVLLAQLGQNTLISWGRPVPVFGRGLTVNSLVDLQWHIFALLVLFGGVWALQDDRHVSVDFLWLMMSPRSRLWMRLLGDLVLLIPFCLIITWYGWSFAQVAWRTAEGSTQGGLNSRWIIKAMLPIAFGMLSLMGVMRVIGTGIQLVRGVPSEEKR